MKKIFLLIMLSLILIQPVSSFSLIDFLKNFDINQITGLYVGNPPTYILTVTKTGSGTITSNPSGINCGIDCSEEYDQGTQVTLTAIPSSSYIFSEWGGTCSGLDPDSPCIINMNSNQEATATFSQLTPPETQNPCQQAGGTCRSTCYQNEHIDNTLSCSTSSQGQGQLGGTGGTILSYCCMPNPLCTENWQCSSWSSCTNNQQTRTCTDLNNCGTTNNKPIETQSCTPQPTTCVDGTSVGACSNNFKYCNTYYQLVENCNLCGCPSNKICMNNECIETFTQGIESNNQNLINLEPVFLQIPTISSITNSILNPINLNLYSSDPEGNILTFTFNNNALTFTSNIVDCIITNAILNCNSKNPGSINLQIKASDGIKSTLTILTVNIFSSTQAISGIIGGAENTPPIADAGADKKAYVNQYIILDASKSYDNENNIITYEWFENENKIGEGITYKTKFTVLGEHKITLKVTDAGNQISTDDINIKIEEKKKCLRTNTIYFPEDTICNQAWPSNEGGIIEINSPIHSCELIEVCNEQLDPIIEDAINCCDSIGLTDQKRAEACNFAIRNSKDTKKCQVLYLIKALGSNAVYMQDYFEAEMCCYGVEELCLNPLNLYSAKPKPKTNKDLTDLRCPNTLDNNPKGSWLSDTKIELNNIALSDIHSGASINILSTGTCVDYSAALTTLSRKIGYSKEDIFTVEATTHAYNLIRFPLDKKYTIVDITGNNDGLKIGGVPTGYEYCESIKKCFNDIGENICPSNKEIFGCENIKENIFRRGNIIGKGIKGSLKQVWEAILFEIKR